MIANNINLLLFLMMGFISGLGIGLFLGCFIAIKNGFNDKKPTHKMLSEL